MYIVSTWPALSAPDKGNFAPPPPATAPTSFPTSLPHRLLLLVLQLAYNLHCCLFPFAYILSLAHPLSPTPPAVPIWLAVQTFTLINFS